MTICRCIYLYIHYFKKCGADSVVIFRSKSMFYSYYDGLYLHWLKNSDELKLLQFEGLVTFQQPGLKSTAPEQETPPMSPPVCVTTHLFYFDPYISEEFSSDL